MSLEGDLASKINRVVREIESLLTDLEALEDSLEQAISESRVSKDVEKSKTLENLSANLRKTYEVLKTFYKQLSLVRLRYS